MPARPCSPAVESVCHPNATCSEDLENSAARCACDFGFAGDGRVACTAIDPCDPAPASGTGTTPGGNGSGAAGVCEPGAQCTYRGPGKHSCTCPAGQHLNRLDSCSQNLLVAGPANSRCADAGAAGRSSCTCRQGITLLLHRTTLLMHRTILPCHSPILLLPPIYCTAPPHLLRARVRAAKGFTAVHDHRSGQLVGCLLRATASAPAKSDAGGASSAGIIAALVVVVLVFGAGGAYWVAQRRVAAKRIGGAGNPYRGNGGAGMISNPMHASPGAAARGGGISSDAEDGNAAASGGEARPDGATANLSYRPVDPSAIDSADDTGTVLGADCAGQRYGVVQLFGGEGGLPTVGQKEDSSGTGTAQARTKAPRRTPPPGITYDVDVDMVMSVGVGVGVSPGASDSVDSIVPGTDIPSTPAGGRDFEEPMVPPTPTSPHQVSVI